MSLDDAAIDELATQLRVAARHHRAQVRPEILKSYKELVSLPPEERAAERQRRVEGLTNYLHQKVPAKDPENSAAAMAALRQNLAQLLGEGVNVDEITDDQLTRLIMKWRQGVEEDSQVEARWIMEQAGAVPPAAHKHTKRPHIGI